ncbi:hypothetical protein HJG60_008962 [Phyllostomus discolor]|uniref:Uncharacterized protein n=1 Tax=Phyllostomus discolor TaxID=89673 RepID=A0A834DJC9_9CHIR|nr:hypothetical protein HJG60_008962 [Phyllostomus discolor]
MAPAMGALLIRGCGVRAPRGPTPEGAHPQGCSMSPRTVALSGSGHPLTPSVNTDENGAFLSCVPSSAGRGAPAQAEKAEVRVGCQPAATGDRQPVCSAQRTPSPGGAARPGPRGRTGARQPLRNPGSVRRGRRRRTWWSAGGAHGPQDVSWFYFCNH